MPVDTNTENLELIKIPQANIEKELPQNGSDPLLTAVYSNDLNTLRGLLAELCETDFSKEHLHETDHHGPIYVNILTKACSPQISKDTFGLLYEHAASRLSHLSSTGKRCFYWDPVHFAAYYADYDKLATIVQVLDGSEKLNVLSVFSENALHVLLGYGNHSESFNVQLSNGWESRICHVIPMERPETIRCARLLIDAGVDVNHNNIWNETPLSLAIRYRLLGVIELLLRRRDIDLDTWKDSESRKSARDILKQQEICVQLITPNVTTIISPVKTLFTFLKMCDEEQFLRYNNENIGQYVDALDGGESPNIASGTMLQLCLVKSYFEYKNGFSASTLEDDETDIMKTSMLKFFCKRGFGRSIEHLLNNGADINKAIRTLGNRNVFQMAVKLGYYPFLVLLLEHRSNQISPSNILRILYTIEETGLFELDECYTRHILFLLMSKLESTYDVCKKYSDRIDYDSNEIMNKILNVYLQHNSSKDEYRENICQVLKLGASLSVPYRNMLQHEPNFKLDQISYETLKIHLDECVNSSNEVCYDSLMLDDIFKYSEIDVLYYLTHNPKKRDLLTHPVLAHFIYTKWRKLNTFFFVNIGFHVIFLATLYFYMILNHLDQVNMPFYCFFTTLVSCLSLKEFIQLILYRRHFLSLTNNLELTTIVCCYINIFTKDERTMVISIIISTVMFLLMLGQLPIFTKYMIVFNSTKYFLQYALFYFLQFFAFAICFSILFPPQDNSQYNVFGFIFLKLFESLFFFIGQFDGDITDPPKYKIFGRVIVAMFAICMTIILNNLLVGLIVTDMDIIQKTSKQQRQIKMIRYIARLEIFFKKIERHFPVFSSYFEKTLIFKKGQYKVRNISESLEMLDDDDRAYLKEIHEKRLQRTNVLNNLYKYIIGEIYSDPRSMGENRNILFKLSRLEEQLRIGKMR